MYDQTNTIPQLSYKKKPAPLKFRVIFLKNVHSLEEKTINHEVWVFRPSGHRSNARGNIKVLFFPVRRRRRRFLADSVATKDDILEESLAPTKLPNKPAAFVSGAAGRWR